MRRMHEPGARLLDDVEVLFWRAWYPAVRLLSPRRWWRLAVWRPRSWVMNHPAVARRLPAWLLRWCVFWHLMVVERIEDRCDRREGTLTAPYARQRVRARIESRADVLAVVDQWNETLRQVRADYPNLR